MYRSQMSRRNSVSSRAASPLSVRNTTSTVLSVLTACTVMCSGLPAPMPTTETVLIGSPRRVLSWAYLGVSGRGPAHPQARQPVRHPAGDQPADQGGVEPVGHQVAQRVEPAVADLCVAHLPRGPPASGLA